MNNLISRQAAIDELDDVAELLRRVLDAVDVVGAEREKYEWGLGLIESCISDIKELPSADAQPERKKGKWINDGGLYKCSCCNQLWTEWWVISKPIERMRKECPYCPMCGSYNGETQALERSN